MEANKQNEDQYRDIAAQYKANKEEDYRQDLELPNFIKYLGNIAEKSVLDLGCGEGYYTRIIREKTTGSVYGVDVSENMIKLAQSQQKQDDPYRIIYLVGDVLNLELGDFQFDVICCTYLLQHSENAEQLCTFLENIYKYLKPGGRVIGMDSGITFDVQNLHRGAKYGLNARIENDEVKEFNKITLEITNKKTGSQFNISYKHITLPTYDKAFQKACFVDIVQEFVQIPESSNEYLKNYYQDIVSMNAMRFFTASKKLE